MAGFDCVVLALCLLVASASAQEQVQVTVEQGMLLGTTLPFQESEFIGVSKNIDTFGGVPYAEPPVGPLRFQPPQPKQPWEGVYNATYYGNSCVQDPANLFGLPMGEDCLNLNIYAPNPRPTGAAVMVWIHGGGFTFGTGAGPSADGRPLVAVGDVIVVTINYRLNVFGFLTTADEALPGNLGLHDQVLALQWIKQNIAAFGGDANRITVFGQDAGASSAHLMMLSPKGAGLFNQAILQSGNAFSAAAFTHRREFLRRQAFRIGEAVGCRERDSAALVECLRGQDAEALFRAIPPTEFRASAVVDNDFLFDTPANLYATGRYNHVKVLMGTNADEASLFVLYNAMFADYFTSEDPPMINRDTFDQLVSQDLAYESDDDGFHSVVADNIRMRYVDWAQADYSNASYYRAYVDWLTDQQYICSSDLMARIRSQAGDEVYVYHMTHVPSVSYYALTGVGPGWLGASHGEDIMFVFGLPFVPELAHFFTGVFTRDEMVGTVKIMQFWTMFAKTGNPTIGPAPQDTWPKFTVPELKYKVLNLNLTTDRALKSDECYFWNTFLPQMHTMFGTGFGNFDQMHSFDVKDDSINKYGGFPIAPPRVSSLDATQQEWRQSYYNWKYTDLEQWRDEFAKYRAGQNA